MKSISQDQVDLIDAVLAETDQDRLSGALLEKDIHVTDALVALFQLPLPVKLVFCGGTSLSKAHGLIRRMSEDVDLKVVIDPSANLSRSAIRTQLSELKSHIAQCLTGIGLREDESSRRVQNENRYFAMHWDYDTRYGHQSGLRPFLQLEVTQRTPKLSLEDKQVTYLVNELAGKSEQLATLACTSVAETLAEKVVSFLRRYAQNRAGAMRQDWDKALVRHVYDVYCIEKQQQGVISAACDCFAGLVTGDVKEFGKQFAAFAEDSRLVLEQALQNAEIDPEIHTEYDTHLLPLVFGRERPSFYEAYDAFKRVASQLTSRL